MQAHDIFNSVEQTCKHLGISYVNNLLSFPLVSSKRPLVSYTMAKEKKILPLVEEEEKITIACIDPLALQMMQELRVYFGKKIERVCCPKEVLEQAIEYAYHETDSCFYEENEDIETAEKQSYDLLEDLSSHPTVRILNAILREAIQIGASDIHFEPKEEGLKVRFRVDGILQKPFSPPSSNALQIITRLKVMAQLDIAEKRLPQDGRIKLFYGKREIDFRMSTIPVIQGERVVLRILDRGNVILGLDKIDMPPSILQSFRKIINASEGMILVTGPTGSGKTTTLYSALHELPSSELNIMTIEDPVEYKLPAISQIGVNPKISLTFHSGLKHILRQDPDVIMIGEIRDIETAQIAVQSALTGHLVFSTLHTNDAPSAITRLADMGIEPYLLTSSVIGILAQRLVRKICSHCKIRSSDHLIDNQVLQGLSWSGDHFLGKGCEQCHQTGYKGRTAIYEFMPLTQEVKRQILSNVDSDEIKKATFLNKENLTTCGAELVRKGITTLQEVLRVTNANME